MRSNIIQTPMLMLFLAGALALPGCGTILTESQVKEVAAFAVAARAYGAFPGAVIKSHADLSSRRKIVEAAGVESGATASHQAEATDKIRQELEQRAVSAAIALDILNDYASLLVKLTAENYSDDLQGDAEKLGRTVDRGIILYNKQRGANLVGFGALAAAGMRGRGGIAILHEQAQALKNVVTSAAPVIETMIEEVENILALYLAPPDLKGLKLTMTDDGLKGANEAVLLAITALQGAETYRDAHRKLAECVTQPRRLLSSVDRIKAFSDQINEANRLRKKIPGNS